MYSNFTCFYLLILVIFSVLELHLGSIRCCICTYCINRGWNVQSKVMGQFRGLKLTKQKFRGQNRKEAKHRDQVCKMLEVGHVSVVSFGVFDAEKMSARSVSLDAQPAARDPQRLKRPIHET